MIGGVSQTGSEVFALARSRRGDAAARAAAAKDDVSGAAARDDVSGAADATGDKKSTGASGKPLTSDQQQQVSDLRQRDAEVRQHEAAHQAAGGAHAGGASYTYQRGPDGKNYAVGGEVQVDVSQASTPQATISKMDQIKAAALAPAEPSPQDQRVASLADAIKAQAQQELRQQPQEKGGGTVGENSGESGGESGATANGGASDTGFKPTESRRATGAYAAAAGIGGGVSRAGSGGLLAVSA
jgi:hypothetical protein